ncbi:MAG: NADH-quinone oxidoreductase subunit L, partial [Desulfofustis sp.]
NGHIGIWLIGVLVAGMTAYYTFRMIFVVFHGSPRDQKAYEHAHESPKVMTVPLLFLAAGSIFAGSANIPAIFGGNQRVTHWLSPSLVEQHPHASIGIEILAVSASILAFVIGISIAYRKFTVPVDEPDYEGVYKFAYHKFFVDELYHRVIVAPYRFVGAAISRVLEPYVTDAPVQASGWLYRMFGLAFKVVQVGYVRIYAIYMVVGLSILSLLLSRSLNL